MPVALLTVIAFEAWRYFPFAFLFLIARLQALPGDLEEAAASTARRRASGSGTSCSRSCCRRIALLAVLRFIFTFNEFDDIYLLTGGGAGTEVVSVRVYYLLTARGDVGAASAQALVLALILVVLLVLYFRFFGRRRRGRVTDSRSASRPRRRRWTRDRVETPCSGCCAGW